MVCRKPREVQIVLQKMQIEEESIGHIAVVMLYFVLFFIFIHDLK